MYNETARQPGDAAQLLEEFLLRAERHLIETLATNPHLAERERAKGVYDLLSVATYERTKEVPHAIH